MRFVQPNMQAQEELAALFSRNLTLDAVPSIEEEPQIVYISQHYNHSAHLVQQQQQQQEQQQQQAPRPASEPPVPQHAAVETVLRNHGVDPSALSSSQLQLFKTAEEPQQLRLLELWRICPPTNNRDNPALAWSTTTVEQEEMLARARHEQQQQQQQQQPPQTVMSLDGTPLTPIQAGDGRWVTTVPHGYMEPYMMSGYEEMARREYEDSARRAYAEAMDRPKDVYQHFGTGIGGPTYKPSTDPVYQNVGGGTATAALEWQRQQQQQQQQQQAMEDTYGRMVQLRRDDDEEML